jgi:hypothetical protein
MALPARFGFWTEPVFMLAAPAGRLFADCGMDAPALGVGGDWVAPACAKTGPAANSRATAGTYFNMVALLELVVGGENALLSARLLHV